MDPRLKEQQLKKKKLLKRLRKKHQDRGRQPLPLKESFGPFSHRNNTAGSRIYRWAAVCLGLLCVFLFTAVLVLWFRFMEEKDQLEANYSNLTTERDQLEISYNNLIIERDQLYTSYTSLTKETQNLDLTTERDWLQERLSDLGKRLMTHINKPEWRYFSSSVHYISIVEKTWNESRNDCMKKEADLVIINNKEEQDFIEMLRQRKEAWIGLTDNENEGIWKWVNGSRLTTEFWYGGEPNNYGEEDCAVAGFGSTNEKSCADYPCSYWRVCICERRILS
ncbi:CD209 antigen-like protein 2 [Hoplias malabaricus]|uniref:CD209 antigen-like protein 2 n=1 Tax=Hoplias malabaricus TaxID=27720 RepID=UPI00346280A3